MRTHALHVAAAALAGSAGLPSSFAAAVEASALTTITIDAPLYDTSLSTAGGCDPGGCVGDLTRVSVRRCSAAVIGVGMLVCMQNVKML